MKAMLKSMSPPLNNLRNAENFLDKIMNFFRYGGTPAGAVSSFADEFLTKTLRNPDAREITHRTCMLKTFKDMYYEHNGNDAISHAVATELQKLLLNLRNESSQTAHADVS